MILNERQRKVLEFLNEPKDRYEVMAKFNLTLVSARDLLRKFVAAGLVEQFRGVPKGRGPPCMVYIKKSGARENGKDKPQAQLVAVQERPEGDPQ